MSLKQKFTQEIMSHMANPMSYEHCFRHFWITSPSSDCLRLSAIGLAAMREYGNPGTLKAINGNSFSTSQLLMGLRNHAKSPYFIDGGSVLVFDTDLIALIALYGSVQEWLESVGEAE